jgi:ferrous iron transport protein A
MLRVSAVSNYFHGRKGEAIMRWRGNKRNRELMRGNQFSQPARVVSSGGRDQAGEPLTLANVEVGQKVKIVGVNGGWGGRERLLSMGLGPETIVEVISAHPFQGPVVVGAAGAQVALGRQLAHKIMVEEMREEVSPSPGE